MPGAAAERRSGLAAVLDELERVRDVAHREAEGAAVTTRPTPTVGSTVMSVPTISSGRAGAQRCVHGIHVGGRGSVHGDQRADPDQRVSARRSPQGSDWLIGLEQPVDVPSSRTASLRSVTW